MSVLTASSLEGQERAPETGNLVAVDNRSDDEDDAAPLAAEIAELDALLARSQRLLDRHAGRSDADELTEAIPSQREDDPLGLFGDDEWNEEERLQEWRGLITLVEEQPPSLAAAILFDAWERIEPLRRQHWLGGLLIASSLRARGKVTSHLFSFHTGLKQIRHERRRSRDRITRLQAFLDAMRESAVTGLKEIDRLSLARTQMELRFRGRRSNSSLPQLADFILSRPMVSAAMVARELNVTQRGALNLINEIGTREITGRGRYRAWGII
jgi:hypothetical protein